ncbi:pseudouridine synthase [Zavarzinia aquatilis]|uniref:Pseudouridine synthase n=1 Tax=Zavarzinia aquatilis TaxID=2211142 RepID=A0A317EIR2_9PROT|nr:pseudouridine synthase [Zavarzinia aquatilis]PWR25960.1 pseudouridine synthase [Zavarzinia aquatilis]
MSTNEKPRKTPAAKAKPEAKSATPPETAVDDGPERIAKYLARAGICSRRDAEKLIEEGKVAVDGVTLNSPAFKVTGAERITVDGKVVGTPAKARLWRFHKPRGLVVSHKDDQGRVTVFDFLRSQGLPRVISVGRLDLNSEGLLLLTNDGELARKLELPSNGWVRHYKVRVAGEIDVGRLEALKKGITIDGVRYGSIEVEIDRIGGLNAWLYVSLTEGKNREIRKVMDHLRLSVNRLLRVSYGPFDIEKLEAGDVAPIGQAIVDKILRGEEVLYEKPAPKPPKPLRADKAEAPAEPARAGKAAPAGRDAAARPERRKSSGAKPEGGKPEGRKPFGSKSEGEGPERRKSFGAKPEGGKPEGRKTFGSKSEGERPEGRRSFGAKPEGGKPEGRKPFGSKSEGERPEGRRSFGAKPEGAKSEGRKPFGPKPEGMKTEGRRPASRPPTGDKPRGEKPARPAGDRPTRSTKGPRDANRRRP